MRSRRNKNSRRNRSSRRQRGGVVLTPGAVAAPTVLLPAGVGALVQGAQFAQQHLGQHGGAAPIGAEMALPSGMANAAMQGKLLSALNEIKGMSDMAGGRRVLFRKKHGKKSKKGSRKAGKKSRKSRKASRKSRKSRRRSSQRGGQAPVSASYMTGVEAKGTHPQFNNFTSL